MSFQASYLSLGLLILTAGKTLLERSIAVQNELDGMGEIARD